MKKYISVIIFLLLISCKSGWDVKAPDTPAPDDKTTEAPMEIQPLEIKTKFFRYLQPWKKGKLAAIDGWGRFSEISFGRKNQVKIKNLVNFPRRQIDPRIMVWPEEELFISHSKFTYHIADLKNHVQKSVMPYFSGLYLPGMTSLLNPEEGLIILNYQLIRNFALNQNIIYNYRTDTVVYKGENKSEIGFERPLDNDWILCRRQTENSRLGRLLYNWKTGEIIENKLTEALSDMELVETRLGYGYGIHPEKRWIIGISWALENTMLKIDWSEDYKDVNVFPLDVLLPQGKTFSSTTFFFSRNGEWATCFISWDRANEKFLRKRAFFHIDSRYPGAGVSPPVFAEGYEAYSWDYGAFVEHPEYGWCYATDYEKDDGLYMRLYKMSDVMTEINKVL